MTCDENYFRYADDRSERRYCRNDQGTFGPRFSIIRTGICCCNENRYVSTECLAGKFEAIDKNSEIAWLQESPSYSKDT